MALALCAACLGACLAPVKTAASAGSSGLVLSYAQTEGDQDPWGAGSILIENTLVENTSATTLEYVGTGPGWPRWSREAWTDHGWIALTGNWCGTGLISVPLAPGESFTAQVAPLVGGPHDVSLPKGLAPGEDIEYLGLVRSGIRLRDPDADEFISVWTEPFAAQPKPSTGFPFEALRALEADADAQAQDDATRQAGE